MTSDEIWDRHAFDTLVEIGGFNPAMVAGLLGSLTRTHRTSEPPRKLS